ncbi:MAG: MFS transporter [Oscillospiraceae bacterium]|nr:MFS transporter [Oscillospiraceae bacterium]
MSNQEVQLNEFGMEPLKPANYFVYGLGNFASQLSWMMVSTYLSIFYTDVFGLGTGTVALLLLIAKVWDAINDPMMGTIMERTHTKWGRFRPYIVIGSILLFIFTILTFSVPGFKGGAALAYAYVTYIGLGMSYTMTNVPYLALPVVMTRDPKEVNRLNAAQMMGMTIGQIVLNLSVLPLVMLIGKGDQAHGYHGAAIILAGVALPIFWAVAYFSKERITVEKEDQGSVIEGLKLIARNKNLVCALAYSCINMFGILGRISVAVYFYMHCVGNFAMITLFMMMQMIVGTIIMPLAPKACNTWGKRKTAIISMVIQGAALIGIYLGSQAGMMQNIPFQLGMMIFYGLGYIAGPAGAGMVIDSIDDFDDKYGYRNDGMAFSFSGLATKLGTALANSLFLVIMGKFGYDAMFGLQAQLEEIGADAAEAAPLLEQMAHIKSGINLCANLLPGIVFLIGIIPLLMYKLDKPGYMEDVRSRLAARDAAKKAAKETAEA